VGLEMVPNAPPPVFHQLKPEYDEIPTLPSEVEQLMATLPHLLGALAHLDVCGLSEKLSSVLTRADTSLSQLSIPEINAGVTNLLTAANNVVANPNLTNSFAALKQTLNH